MNEDIKFLENNKNALENSNKNKNNRQQKLNYSSKILSHSDILKSSNFVQSLNLNNISLASNNSIENIFVMDHYHTIDLFNKNYIGGMKSFLKSSKYLLLTDSFYVKIWNVILLILVAYLAYIIPMEIAEGSRLEKVYYYVFMNVVTDAIFLFDLFLNFFLVDYTDLNIYHFTNFDVIAKYLRSYFIIDLITSFPLETLAYMNILNMKLGINIKIIKVLKANKFVKIYVMIQKLKNKMVEDFEDFLHSYSLIENFINIRRITFGLLSLLFLSHISACIMVFDTASIYVNWYYYIIKDQYELCDSYLHSFCQDTLEEAYMTAVEDRTYLYRQSAYYIAQTVTTVGYGDIFGDTNRVELKIILVMFGGICMNIFISLIVEFMFTKKMANHENIGRNRQASAICQRYNFSRYEREIVYQLIDYYSCYNLAVELNFINRLPNVYKIQILYQIRQHFSNIYTPSFISDSKTFLELYKITFYRKLIYEEDLYLHDKPANFIYFVEYGSFKYWHWILKLFNTNNEGDFSEVQPNQPCGLSDCLLLKNYWFGVVCKEHLSSCVYVNKNLLLDVAKRNLWVDELYMEARKDLEFTTRNYLAIYVLIYKAVLNNVNFNPEQVVKMQRNLLLRDSDTQLLRKWIFEYEKPSYSSDFWYCQNISNKIVRWIENKHRDIARSIRRIALGRKFRDKYYKHNKSKNKLKSNKSNTLPKYLHNIKNRMSNKIVMSQLRSYIKSNKSNNPTNQYKPLLDTPNYNLKEDEENKIKIHKETVYMQGLNKSFEVIQDLDLNDVKPIYFTDIKKAKNYVIGVNEMDFDDIQKGFG